MLVRGKEAISNDRIERALVTNITHSCLQEQRSNEHSATGQEARLKEYMHTDDRAALLSGFCAYLNSCLWLFLS
jgi:hypothetical protein